MVRLAATQPTSASSSARGNTRPSLRKSRVAQPALVRLLEAVLPHQRALDRRAPRGCTVAKREEAPSRLRAAPVSRCNRADQLRGQQSRSHPSCDAEQGCESGARAQASQRGRRTRPHPHERRERIRGRPQYRRHARRRRVSEPDRRADSVHAPHRAGIQPALVHRAAVHQQVLHPGSAAGEFVRTLRTGSGLPGLPGLLAQRAARAGRLDLGRLHAPGRIRAAGSSAGNHRLRSGQRARVLRRRHIACVCVGGNGASAARGAA